MSDDVNITIHWSPKKLTYGENVTASFRGTWPASLRKGRLSVTVWYEDLPDPVYKSSYFHHCHDPRMIRYDFCKLRKGEFFKGVVEYPFLFKSNNMVLVGSLFTPGWYTFKFRLYNEFDEEYLCAEARLYAVTTRN